MAIMGLKTAWGNWFSTCPSPSLHLHKALASQRNLQHRELHSIHRLGGLKQHRYTTTVQEAGVYSESTGPPFSQRLLGEPISFMFHLLMPPAFPGCCLQSPSLLPLLLCEGYWDQETQDILPVPRSCTSHQGRECSRVRAVDTGNRGS